MDTYRWTLDEYLLRCEDGSELAEILVEGELDRDIFVEAVKRWECDVAVVDADYVSISLEELQKLQLPGDGVKWQLVAIAMELERRAVCAQVAARVAVVVDRDYDGPVPESRFLFETDGHSMENYALDPHALDRLIALGLGRSRRPDGKGGAGRAEGSLCTGSDMLDRVFSATAEIAAIRITLREQRPPLAPFRKWVDYARPSSEGYLAMDGQLLLSRIMELNGLRSEAGSAERRRILAREDVVSDPFRLFRGKDFVALIKRVVDSPWGRRFSRSAFLGWRVEQLSRILMLSIPGEDLDKQSLFQQVRAVF